MALQGLTNVVFSGAIYQPLGCCCDSEGRVRTYVQISFRVSPNMRFRRCLQITVRSQLVWSLRSRTPVSFRIRTFNDIFLQLRHEFRELVWNVRDSSFAIAGHLRCEEAAER
jgi:hypothetical protein